MSGGEWCHHCYRHYNHSHRISSRPMTVGDLIIVDNIVDFIIAQTDEVKLLGTADWMLHRQLPSNKSSQQDVPVSCSVPILLLLSSSCVPPPHLVEKRPATSSGSRRSHSRPEAPPGETLSVSILLSPLFLMTRRLRRGVLPHVVTRCCCLGLVVSLLTSHG